jgi:hypothetical protein
MRYGGKNLEKELFSFAWQTEKNSENVKYWGGFTQYSAWLSLEMEANVKLDCFKMNKTNV